jgi:flagellin-like hook-associated protein FlgL
MVIGSTADTSMHVARSRIRQRELLHSSRILSSGNKFEGINGQVSDLGGHSFSSGMQARLKTEEAAKGNIQHALSFVQTQSDGLKTVARILSRMEELAYHSTDPILSENDRHNLDIEFGALKQSLSGISSEKQFGTKLFDPLAARYESRFPVLGISGGDWQPQEQTVDIGAKRGKIHLWWNPTWQTDRMKVYHGSNMIFDSGEYRTTHLLPGGREFGGFDNFTIEFGGNTQNSTANAGNTGVSLHDKDVGTEFPAKTTQAELDWYLTNQPFLSFPVDYKKFKTNDDYPKTFGSPYGDTEIKFVVNETENVPGGFPYTRQSGSSTVWEYYAEIEKSNLTDQSVLVDSEGGTLELNAIGFSDLSHLTVSNARLAVSSLDTLSEELGNIRYQMGVMAGEIAAFEARLNVLNGKTYHEKIALNNTTGVDLAKELTHMAKNQILESATARAMLHSRLSTERVLDLIL